MSIDRKEFERKRWLYHKNEIINQKNVSVTLKKELLMFLRKNSTRAYSFNELSNLVKVRKGVLHSTLHSMLKEKLLEHKPYYWMLRENEEGHRWF